MESEREERQRLTRVFNEHLPVVQEASFRLQEMMGISLDDRAEKHASFAPWDVPTPGEVKDASVQTAFKPSGTAMGPPPRPTLGTGQRSNSYREINRTFPAGDLEKSMHHRRLALGQMPPDTSIGPTISDGLPFPQPRQPLSTKDSNLSISYRNGHGLIKPSDDFSQSMRQIDKSQPFHHAPTTTESINRKRKMNNLSLDSQATVKDTKVPKIVIDLTSPEGGLRHSEASGASASVYHGQSYLEPTEEGFEQSVPGSVFGSRIEEHHEISDINDSEQLIKRKRHQPFYRAPVVQEARSPEAAQSFDGCNESSKFALFKPRPIGLSSLYCPPMYLPRLEGRAPIVNMDYLMSLPVAFRTNATSSEDEPPAYLQEIAEERKRTLYDPTANVPTDLPINMTHLHISPIPTFQEPLPRALPLKPISHCSSNLRTMYCQHEYSPPKKEATTETPGCPSNSGKTWCSGCSEERSCDKGNTDTASHGGSLLNEDDEEEVFCDEEEYVVEDYHPCEDWIDASNGENVVDENSAPQGEFLDSECENDNTCGPSQDEFEDLDYIDTVASQNGQYSSSDKEYTHDFDDDDDDDDDPAYHSITSENSNYEYDTIEEESPTSSSEKEPQQQQPTITNHPLPPPPPFYHSDLSNILAAHLANKNTLISTTDLQSCTFFHHASSHVSPMPLDPARSSSPPSSPPSSSPRSSPRSSPPSSSPTSTNQHKILLKIRKEETTRLRAIHFVLPGLLGHKIMTDKGALVDRLPREWVVLEIVDRVAPDYTFSSASYPFHSSFSSGSAFSSLVFFSESLSEEDSLGGNGGMVGDEDRDSDIENQPPRKSEFESEGRRGGDEEEEDQDHGCPYTLVAFPVQAFTTSDTSTSTSTTYSSSTTTTDTNAFSTGLPTPQRRGAKNLVQDKVKMKTSTLHFGKKGRWPLIHSRGQSDVVVGGQTNDVVGGSRGLDSWIVACGLGEGGLEMEFQGQGRGCWER